MISRSYLDPAIIEISLRVTDGEGATDVETHSLTVRDTQRPLAAFAATPNPALTGETVTFDASASATDIGDIPITKYEWDLDGDGQFEIEDNDSLTAESYADPAIIEISLRVTDEEGDTDVETRSLTVENRAPIAAFRYSPRAPEVGERVEFTSRSIDPDGTLRAVRWDLDGNGGFGNARGKTVVRSFSKPGEYSVGLKATDSHGATDETVRTVVVVKPAPSFIAPFPVVRIAGRVSSATRIVRLSVRAARGSKVTVRCRGRSCPVRAITRRARRGAVRFHRLERLLRPGTRIVIRVTRPGQIGKYTRFRMRARKAPARLDRCLLPGVRRPVRCTEEMSRRRVLIVSTLGAAVFAAAYAGGRAVSDDEATPANPRATPLAPASVGLPQLGRGDSPPPLPRQRRADAPAAPVRPRLRRRLSPLNCPSRRLLRRPHRPRRPHPRVRVGAAGPRGRRKSHHLRRQRVMLGAMRLRAAASVPRPARKVHGVRHRAAGGQRGGALGQRLDRSARCRALSELQERRVAALPRVDPPPGAIEGRDTRSDRLADRGPPEPGPAAAAALPRPAR